ncbi:uncharacterized protein LOC128550924 [Mercenaria mercenaria]|uniref:uncharacterized protein LOC128550924 n=1 Tax=Mercenaria mercenaria TaxID=6596 RepID=UPI00234FA1B7|nr:uncharacterized protein LOC128550924 [Mercenaria mercenaria]XP_053386970.1 uncharacterized protein LOC128550924 [Mercenaria mercenaria]
MTFQYNFGHKYRGRALIIGNEFIWKKKEEDGKIQYVIERKGCAKDLEMMEELFIRLDFKVTIRKNLKADDMKTELQKAASSAENEDSDCFVLVISTHGAEIKVEKEKAGSKKGTGKIPAAKVWKHAVQGEDKEEIFVEDIVDMFNNDKTRGLAGKPKLFFIQACRSRGSSNSPIRRRYANFDPGYPLSVEKPPPSNPTGQLNKIWKYTDVDVTKEYKELYQQWQDLQSKVCHSHGITCVTTEDPNKLKGKAKINDTDEDGQALKKAFLGCLPQYSSTRMSPLPFDVTPINCPNDFLIMYPVMPEKAAFRYSSGSYFLECLHKSEHVYQLINRANILQYLTSVSQDMAMEDFFPDLTKNSEPELRTLLESHIEHLSKNRAILEKVLKKKITGDETLVATKLKRDINTYTKTEMQAILYEISPFKVTACLVHRLRGSVSFLPKSSKSTSPMKKVVDDYKTNHPQVKC